jgi:hypothetical protein
MTDAEFISALYSLKAGRSLTELQARCPKRSFKRVCEHIDIVYLPPFWWPQLGQSHLNIKRDFVTLAALIERFGQSESVASLCRSFPFLTPDMVRTELRQVGFKNFDSGWKIGSRERRDEAALSDRRPRVRRKAKVREVSEEPTRPHDPHLSQAIEVIFRKPALSRYPNSQALILAGYKKAVYLQLSIEEFTQLHAFLARVHGHSKRENIGRVDDAGRKYLPGLELLSSGSLTLSRASKSALTIGNGG